MKRMKLGVSMEDLPKDLLIMIFERLSLVDLIRAGAVSRTWCEVWRLCLPSVNMKNPTTPWLMWWEESKPFKAFAKNLEENGRPYTIEGLWEDTGSCSKPQIIGGSNGWIVMLDWKKANPYLLNPFTKTQIKLPPIERLCPSLIKRVTYHHPYPSDELVLCWGNHIMSLASFDVAMHLKSQAIVMVDKGNKVNGVFVRLLWAISYWRRRDGHYFSMKRERAYPGPWNMMLEDNNKLYVLNSSWNVEMWNFHDGTFEKQREIVNAALDPNLYFERGSMISYMVKIMETGEVLIAVLREFCGVQKDRWELYKMNVVGKEGRELKWEKVRQLDEYEVFVGHNEPMGLLAKQGTGYRVNAVNYDTQNQDKYWYEDDMDELVLVTKSIRSLLKLPFGNVAAWIVPNLSE